MIFGLVERRHGTLSVSLSSNPFNLSFRAAPKETLPPPPRTEPGASAVADASFFPPTAPQHAPAVVTLGEDPFESLGSDDEYASVDGSLGGPAMRPDLANASLSPIAYDHNEASFDTPVPTEAGGRPAAHHDAMPLPGGGSADVSPRPDSGVDSDGDGGGDSDAHRGGGGDSDDGDSDDRRRAAVPESTLSEMRGRLTGSAFQRLQVCVSRCSLRVLPCGAYHDAMNSSFLR